MLLFCPAMFQRLTDYIRARVEADDASLSFVLSHFKPAKARRGELLLNFGDVCRYCYFTNKGAIQIFYLDKNGDEATRDFVFEGTWVTELSSFIHQQPAKESFKALEPLELLSINRESFFKLVESVPQFSHIYQRNLETSYTRSVDRIGSFVSMDAEQRVRWLYENQPHLLTRLSNKVVASYLGISPETLSRMKTRL